MDADLRQTLFGIAFNNPLVVATGAGWEMRRSLGTAVFSGMIGVTLFGIFLTPVFFFVINRLTESQLVMNLQKSAIYELLQIYLTVPKHLATAVRSAAKVARFLSGSS